jgi:hypothetical protein
MMLVLLVVPRSLLLLLLFLVQVRKEIIVAVITIDVLAPARVYGAAYDILSLTTSVADEVGGCCRLLESPSSMHLNLW